MSGIARLSTVLAAACLGLMVGCHTLKLAGLGGDKVEKPEKADKGDKEATPARPGRYSFRVSQYVFYSDVELQRDAPIFQELAELREQVYKELQLPASASLVHVYLFTDEDTYYRFLRAKHPGLPRRRAFFVVQPHGGMGGGEDLLIYTYWSDRIRQDLRHELTHALLHSVLKGVPLWLDEGLAEYFELPPDWHGVNRAHVRKLREAGFRPNLARLEQLSLVEQMNPPEYREAWAWVYLMLRGSPDARGALLAYLQLLRTSPNPGALQPKLAEVFPSLDDALDELLVQLDAERRTTEPPRAREENAAGR
jgi:hypothetical protein